MLNGGRFTRLFPCVWALRTHVMTDSDWVLAARLAVPTTARVTDLTRIRCLGLDDGPLRPFHFVIESDLHIDIPDIFLHRTVELPPVDQDGVTPAAAFIAYAATARVINAIKVGDWLLHNKYMTMAELVEIAEGQRWRPGAPEALWVAPFLDGDSRSMKESETRALLVFAGLPVPGSNKEVAVGPQVLGVGDLSYLRWRLVVEYEGSQHLNDRGQWNSDIDRYAGFRDNDVNYVQVTQEKLRMPRKLVSEVYRQLVRGGYDGPAPIFGQRWRSLFDPIRAARPYGGELRTTISGRR